MLNDANEERQSDPEVIAKLFVDLFRDLLGKRETLREAALKSILSNGLILTSEIQFNLLKLFEEKDVKTAFSKLTTTRALGQMGMTVASLWLLGVL